MTKQIVDFGGFKREYEGGARARAQAARDLDRYLVGKYGTMHSGNEFWTPENVGKYRSYMNYKNPSNYRASAPQKVIRTDIDGKKTFIAADEGANTQQAIRNYLDQNNISYDRYLNSLGGGDKTRQEFYSMANPDYKEGGNIDYSGGAKQSLRDALARNNMSTSGIDSSGSTNGVNNGGSTINTDSVRQGVLGSAWNQTGAFLKNALSDLSNGQGYFNQDRRGLSSTIKNTLSSPIKNRILKPGAYNYPSNYY